MRKENINTCKSLITVYKFKFEEDIKMNNNDELQMQVSPICNKNGDYRHPFITRYLIIALIFVILP